MGWDEISELEPPDKFATKGDGSRSKKTPNKSTDYKSEDNDDEEEESDEELVPFSRQRRIFAVQGRKKDLPLQFRFDLSLRTSIDSSRGEQDMFVTFKGSSPRSAQPLSFLPKDFAPISVDGTVERRIILRDALLTRSNDRNIDIRSHFDSSKPGCGLVELSKFGVRPLADQDLSFVKKHVKAFVFDTPVVEDTTDPGISRSNIIVRRTGLDDIQYLLNVGEPMEAGQTMPLCFPSVAEIFKSSRFESSVSEKRHILIEAFQVLSKSDIRLTLEFLENELLDEAALEPNEKLARACVSRLRISWLASHLIRLAGSQKPDLDMLERLMFGVKLPNLGEEVDPDITTPLNEAISQEFRVGLLSLLELDNLCGGDQRDGWCPAASKFFDDAVSEVTKFKPDYPTATKQGLIDLYETIAEIKSRMDDKALWLFKSSPLAVDENSEKENVAVCKANGKIPLKAVSKEELEGEELAVQWYKKFFVQIQCKIIHACGFLLPGADFPTYEILEEMKPLAGDEPVTLEYALPGVKKFPFVVPSLPKDMYQPHSLQFFLGIVWPILREFGWRVEVVTYPSETKYIAPQWRGDQQKQGKLAKLAKQQRDRRRAELSRGVNQMGLGTLPKFTKRLFIASKPSEKDGSSEDKKSKTTKPVSAIVELFLKSSFEEGKKSLEKAKEVIDLILQCFDEQAPSLCKEVNELALDDSKPARDICSIDIFMQFLLVLPSLLTQSDLPLQEINDSLQVIQDLTAFCNEHCQDVFPPEVVPPVEHYTTEEKLPSSNLVHRLSRSSKISQGSEALTEVIWEEDKKVLSDFVVSVMDQVRACRATEEDTRRKHRKIHVGYPGAVCKHCMGQTGEGRYFFTTIESLTTLGTVFEKHFAKCSAVPQEVKKAIVANKARHHEQRKLLPAGSQQAYFLRLWDRLRTMRISGGDGSMIPITQPTFASPEKKKEDDKVADIVHEKREFTNSLEVLEYVRTTVPWKGTKEIDDALNQYYTCVDFGGRIYNTRGMPKHFSPAWLLAKVGPKKLKVKRMNLPG